MFSCKFCLRMCLHTNDKLTPRAFGDTGRWFSPVSSTNKTDRHDITEILLKVALDSISYTITIETKEAVRIGYNGFLFPHSSSCEGIRPHVKAFEPLSSYEYSLDVIHLSTN